MALGERGFYKLNEITRGRFLIRLPWGDCKTFDTATEAASYAETMDAQETLN